MTRHMISWRGLLGACAVAATVAVAPARAQAEDLVVFAAASLKNAMDAVTEAWTAKSGTGTRVSYAGSSALARQIQNGAPADVFISANPGWMDTLGAEGLLRAGTRTDLLGNSIVLIAPAVADAAPVTLAPGVDLAGLVGNGHLAMAIVDAVPAGIYGKAALTSLGAWEAVAPRVAQADNVRAALALVARDEAPYGIVYATDAAASDDVEIVGTFPADSHPPIIYPVAILAESGNDEAAPFLAFLGTPEAAALFAAHGFTVLD